jgi:hypothetical protein
VQVALIFLNHRKLIECGIPIKQTSNRRKYCKSCWKDKQLQWQRESMRKLRKRRCEVLENPANLHE